MKDFLSVYCRKQAVQEKVVCCFSLGATVTHRAQSIFDILWQNLCSFKRLNFKPNLNNNLTPAGLWIAYNDFCFNIMKSFNVDLNHWLLSAFHRVISNLYHSLTQKGKKWLLEIFSSCFKSFDIVSSDASVERVIISICDALRDVVPFVQFKKCEEHPWRSVNFSKVTVWSLQLY